MFATRRIRRGTTIIEYIGERISTEEADNRYDDDAMDRTHTFLFTVDDDTVIDATYEANEAKYINHSCDPNCETYIDDGRIFVESIRTIEPGEELTYDYKLERGGEVREEWIARYVCNCGTAKCRGTLLAPITKRKPNTFKKRRAG
jgi:uncharacterized protein